MLGAGAVSHVSAGGLLPHPVVLLLMAAGFTALAGRFVLGPASTLRIVTLVVVGQSVAHTALSALAGHRGDLPSAAPAAAALPTLSLPTDADGRRVGSLLDAYHAGDPGTTGHDAAGVPVDWAAHLLHHLAEQGPLMLASHVAGAIFVGMWLAVGEQALWALLHLAATRAVVAAGAHRVAAAALAVLRGGAAVPLPRPRSTGFTPVPRHDRPALSRRGPPLLLAA